MSDPYSQSVGDLESDPEQMTDASDGKAQAASEAMPPDPDDVNASRV